MKILSLNCQKNFQPGLAEFLQHILSGGEYDALLLQEASDEVRIQLTHPGYRLLVATDTVVQKKSMLCIVFKNEIELTIESFQSFSNLRFDPVEGYKHLGFGILGGKFMHKGKIVCLFSTHLHSGLDAGIRVKEFVYVQERMRELADGAQTIAGGDFNFGYPWELGRASRMLTSEYEFATTSLGGTLDSRYSELVDHLPNKVAHALARFGLGVSLRADHFILDKTSARKSAVHTRILPERVSDHSPIELVIT
ncbi:MAG: hypothetical protein JWL75_435 [Parcubacteria group bacterium]|nr:hypothetical protein [Parcubacteria group bacterium]